MKMFKLIFILLCLLAYVVAFWKPVNAQAAQPASVSIQSMAAVDSLPFRMLLEKACPLYAQRDMASVIATIPAGKQVVALEKYDMGRGDGLVVVRVQYVDMHGTEHTGWVYGTLHVTFPR